MKKAITFIGGFLFGIVIISLWGVLFTSDKSMKATIDATDTQSSEEAIINDGNTATTTLATTTSTKGIQEASAIINTTMPETFSKENKAIMIRGQKVGSSVYVQSITLDAEEKGGWIVVHEIKKGIMANALGAVRKDSGTYQNVEVKLLRGTVSGGNYAVVLYGDNGDRVFNLKTDKPLKDAQGKYIMSTFVAK